MVILVRSNVRAWLYSLTHHLKELIISFLDDESFLSFCSSCKSLRQVRCLSHHRCLFALTNSKHQFYTNYGATIWKQRSLQRWSLGLFTAILYFFLVRELKGKTKDTLTKTPRYGYLCSHAATSFVLDSPFNTTSIETLPATQCQSYYFTRRFPSFYFISFFILSYQTLFFFLFLFVFFLTNCRYGFCFYFWRHGFD